MIIDDDFCLRSVDWLEEFAKTYKQKIDLPFACQATPGRVTREKVRLIRDAGVTFINIGVQTGSDKLNSEVFKRKLGRKHVLRAAGILAEEVPNVGRGFDFLIRNPYETLSDKMETASLLMELPLPFVVRTYALTFFPGLPLTERAYQDGFLTNGKVNSIYDYDGSNEENAWQEVLENAPNVSKENRINLLTQLKEKPPATVMDLIEMLKKAGAQKKKNETPVTNLNEKKQNEIKQTTLQDQINNHYNEGASLLKYKRYENARFAFEKAIFILEELASTINSSERDAGENRNKLSASYIQISMQILECLHARGEYSEASELINKLLNSKLFTVSIHYQNVFKKWLLKYNALEVANSR